MTKGTRKSYTLEYKQEAVRLVESGQSKASVARSLGIVEQTLDNWVRAHKTDKLSGASTRSSLGVHQGRREKAIRQIDTQQYTVLARTRHEKGNIANHFIAMAFRRFHRVKRDPFHVLLQDLMGFAYVELQNLMKISDVRLD